MQVAPDSSGTSWAQRFFQRHLWSSCARCQSVTRHDETRHRQHAPRSTSSKWNTQVKLFKFHILKWNICGLYSQALLPNGLQFHIFTAGATKPDIIPEFGIISPDFIVFWYQSTISTLVYTCWSLKSEPLTLWCEKNRSETCWSRSKTRRRRRENRKSVCRQNASVFMTKTSPTFGPRNGDVEDGKV